MNENYLDFTLSDQCFIKKLIHIEKQNQTSFYISDFLFHVKSFEITIVNHFLSITICSMIQVQSPMTFFH